MAVAVLIVGMQSGWAQETPGSAEGKAKARELYNAGVQAYNVGDFDVAIASWKEAYRLHEAADFLFNIAQAYRGKGDYKNAAFFFNAFIRERPDAPNLEEVIALRDDMDKRLADQRAAEAAAEAAKNQSAITTMDTHATETSADPTPSVSAGQREPTSGRTLRLAGIITGGAGVALLATGIVLSLQASSTADELEQAARDGEPWTQALEDKEKSGERKSMLGAGLIAGGTAALIGGGVSYYLGWRKGRERVTVGVVPSRGVGAAVRLRVEF